MKNLKILWVLLLPLVFGCDKLVDDPISDNSELVELKNTEEYRLDLKISGDEEGAVIKIQSKNHQVSELIRNEETQWSVVYRYKPQPNFVGSDSVEIETCTGGASTGCTQINVIKLKFNIVGS